MAVTCNIRNGGSGSVVFAESSPGVMSNIATSTSYESFTCTGNTMDIAAVSTEAGYAINGWLVESGSSNLSVIGSYSWIRASGSATLYTSVRTSCTSGELTIINEHGSHIGSPTCYNVPYQNLGESNVYGLCCIGVKHNLSDEGWEFIGWECESSNVEIYNLSYEDYEVVSSSEATYQIRNKTSNIEAALVFLIYGTGSVILRAKYKQATPDPNPNPNYPNKSGMLLYLNDSLLFNRDTGSLVF